MTHTEHSHHDDASTPLGASTETSAHAAHAAGSAEHSSAEHSTEHDFSVPEDADFTTPGEPMTDSEHRDTVNEDGQGRPNATPGNPLGEER